jgi:hypothetical protein
MVSRNCAHVGDTLTAVTSPPKRRLVLELQPEYAAKLERIAGGEREAGDLAAALLRDALDQLEMNRERATEEILAVPGALARIRRGSAQSRAGDTIPLADL